MSKTFTMSVRLEPRCWAVGFVFMGGVSVILGPVHLRLRCG